MQRKAMVIVWELFPDEIDYCLDWLLEKCGPIYHCDHVLRLRKHLCEELYPDHENMTAVLELNEHLIVLRQLCRIMNIAMQEEITLLHLPPSKKECL
jgi:hypothetical protein